MAIRTKDVRSTLNPAVISKLKSLELKARTVVEGFKVGLHRSPYHGFSVEFSEHRPYMQGDSLKNIDWKVYAKSEKYFIKQYEEETNLICNIFLDVSNSMKFKHKSEISKYDYSIMLAASLAYLMVDQQDSVGLTIYSDKVLNYLPPKSNRVYLKTILAALSNSQPSGSTSTVNCLNEISENIKKRGLTIVISDLFDEPESLINGLKKIRFKKNEVIVFQVLDPAEKNFGFDRDSVFVDLETNEELTSQPQHIRKAYKDAMKEYLTKIKNDCLNFGIEYNLIDTEEPFDKALFNYFTKRMKMN